MKAEYQNDTPELRIMQSGAVWIKSHNKATADALIQKCPTCVLRGNLCSGTTPQGDDTSLKSDLSQREIRHILKNAACKPKAGETSVASLH